MHGRYLFDFSNNPNFPAAATGSQAQQKTLPLAFAKKKQQPEFKLAFYGEISFKKTNPCIPIARFNLDGGSDDAEIYMSGVVTPGSKEDEGVDCMCMSTPTIVDSISLQFR